jgi:hypothetical protein
MAKSTSFDNSLLQLIFQAATITSLAQNATGGTGNLYISLHTADPTGGNQNTSEATYTGYSRVAVVRTSSGWTVTSNSTTNFAAITFPACNGATSSLVTNVAIGQNATGTAGQIYYTGALTANVNVSNGVTPSFAAGNLTVTES